MLTQEQADRLIALLKRAVRDKVFEWLDNRRQDELLVAVEDGRIQFTLSLKRNPWEIRLHLRTQDRSIGLVRLDGAPYHTNPDGTEIRNQPHLHVYREGHGLAFAEPVDWYDVENPEGTLERFLKEIHARFAAGIQLSLF
ncbi:MAG: hypothetical protein PHC88_16195 [Terrimicrobiaceae bacterium]|nr:hypothetical protein [Terrimicrobiaceae bacterium]